MNYNKVMICILVVLVGFNISLHVPASPGVDPRLVPYVQRFWELCATYNVDCSKANNFKVSLVKMNQWNELYKLIGMKERTVIGHCWRSSNEIDINIEYFERALPAEIEQTVIHEFGHCVLDLEHVEEEKISIMNPYSLYHNSYIAEYSQLMNRFFSCKENCPVVQFNNDRY